MKMGKKLLCVIIVFLMTIGSVQSIMAEDTSDSESYEFGTLLKDGSGTKMGSEDFVPVSLDLSQVVETNIKDYSDCTSDPKDDFNYSSTACALTPGESKFIYYKEALEYGDKLVDMRIDINRTSDPIRSDYYFKEGLKTEDLNHIVVLDDNKVRFYGFGEFNGVGTVVDNRNTKRSTVEVTVSFYYQGSPFGVTGFLGIDDPDGSDYYFDNSSKRRLYYANAPLSEDKIGVAENKMLDEVYVVGSNGLYRNDSDLPVREMPFWDDAKLAIELVNENSFKVKYDMSNDYIIIPSMYSMYYKISYVMNDEDGPAAVNPNKDWTKYLNGESGILKEPTRAGYTFTGWTRTDVDPDDPRNDRIDDKDRGDKVFVANWVKTEYKLAYDPNTGYVDGKEKEHVVENEMDPNPQTIVIGNNDLQENKYTSTGYTFNGWNTKPDGTGIAYTNVYELVASKVEGAEDGAVVETLYAQWTPKEYQIIYNPNDDEKNPVKNPDAMETQLFNLVDNPDKWDSTYPFTYERPGYKFAGYKVENTGDTFENLQDFKEYLLKEEDQKVELFAQWKPWEYYIKYDGNGADNMNAMPTDTFSYFADKMTSKDNAFKRDGYRWAGFKITIDGNSRIIKTPEDFVKVLKAMAPYSSITLIAQWEKIPDESKYIPPVTGIE